MRKLFIGNIPKECTKATVESECSAFGQCAVTVYVFFTQGKFAFADFLHEENAIEAKKYFEHIAVQGSKLKVDFVRINRRFLAEECSEETEMVIETPSNEIFLHTPASLTALPSTLTLEESSLGVPMRRRSPRLSSQPRASPAVPSGRRISLHKCQVVGYEGEALRTPEGGVYTPMKRPRSKQATGTYFCTSCEKELKKKTIYSHRSSLAHQEGLITRTIV